MQLTEIEDVGISDLTINATSRKCIAEALEAEVRAITITAYK